MQSSIQFVGKQRKMLLQYYRSHEQPEIRLRAHIVLLLADGYSWAMCARLPSENRRLHVCAATVRRWLRRAAPAGRRPRPVLTRTDPLRGRILARLRRLLRDLPEDEPVVFMDEVDLNLNPKIGF